MEFEHEWEPWCKTFLFFPVRTVTGKFTIGSAWTRERKAGIFEYDDTIGYNSRMRRTQYARDKKEIFEIELKGVSK